MNLPKFFKAHVRKFECLKCHQPVNPAQKCVTGMQFSQGPGLKQPVMIASVECVKCGAQFGLTLDTPIVWVDIIDWAMGLAAGEGEIKVDPEPPAERIWMRLRKTSIWFGILGGYRRAPVTYLLVRRIPNQPSGFDGRSWDGWLRCRGTDADIVASDDPGALPEEEWPKFQELDENSEFRYGGKTWKKLSEGAIQKIIKSGPLISKSVQ
jgi:transcription elongation factor Elf1